MPKRLRHHPGVAGLDEAGRGPLAGPVVAAAVILPKGFDLEGLDDSKTTRDELMRGYGSVYPGYGFESHFGYAAPEHREALRRLGPCPIHRRSFYPVQEAMQACLTFDE